MISNSCNLLERATPVCLAARKGRKYLLAPGHSRQCSPTFSTGFPSHPAAAIPSLSHSPKPHCLPQVRGAVRAAPSFCFQPARAVTATREALKPRPCAQAPRSARSQARSSLSPRAQPTVGASTARPRVRRPPRAAVLSSPGQPTAVRQGQRNHVLFGELLSLVLERLS